MKHAAFRGNLRFSLDVSHSLQLLSKVRCQQPSDVHWMSRENWGINCIWIAWWMRCWMDRDNEHRLSHLCVIYCRDAELRSIELHRGSITQRRRPISLPHFDLLNSTKLAQLLSWLDPAASITSTVLHVNVSIGSIVATKLCFRFPKGQTTTTMMKHKVVTESDLILNWLFCVCVSDDDGNPLSESSLLWQLRNAIESINCTMKRNGAKVCHSNLSNDDFWQWKLLERLKRISR